MCVTVGGIYTRSIKSESDPFLIIVSEFCTSALRAINWEGSETGTCFRRPDREEINLRPRDTPPLSLVFPGRLRQRPIHFPGYPDCGPNPNPEPTEVVVQIFHSGFFDLR